MASVTKRGWTYNGQRKENWEVRWKDGKKHRSKAFERKKDADAFKRKVEDDLRDGTHVAETMTVEKLAEQYLRFQEDRMRDGVILRGRLGFVRMVMDKTVIPMLGHQKAIEVTAADVRAVYQHLRRERRNCANTAKRRIKELGQLFDFGISREMLKVNVVPAVLKELRGTPQEPIRQFRIEEVQTLLRCAQARRKGRHQRPFELTRCVVHLATFCGLRHGEIMGLTIPNIIFGDRGWIKVRHSMESGGHDVLKGPKTKAGIRDIEMPAHIAAMLQAWIENWYIENDRQIVFRSHSGGEIDTPAFHNSHWRPLLRATALPEFDDGGRRFRFHALRHFFSSYVSEHGESPAGVAALLGHKTFDMTLQVYTHALTGGQRRSEAPGRMAARLLGPPEIEATAIVPET